MHMAHALRTSPTGRPYTSVAESHNRLYTLNIARTQCKPNLVLVLDPCAWSLDFLGCSGLDFLGFSQCKAPVSGVYPTVKQGLRTHLGFTLILTCQCDRPLHQLAHMSVRLGDYA